MGSSIGVLFHADDYLVWKLQARPGFKNDLFTNFLCISLCIRARFGSNEPKALD